jgi:hypothetical protein
MYLEISLLGPGGLRAGSIPQKVKLILMSRAHVG